MSPGRARYMARRRRRQKIRKALIVAGVGLVLGAALLWKPLYYRFRDWRNDRLVQEARTAMEESDWNTAFQRSATVLLTRKTDFDSAWIAFESLRKLNNPIAVELGGWLLRQPQASPDQRFAVLEVLADHAPEAVFFRCRAGLPAAERDDSRSRALFARVLIRREHYWYAELILRFSPEASRDPLLLKELVRLLCIRGLDRDFAEAWRIFESLREAPHPGEAMDVLRLIGSSGRPNALSGAESGLPFWIQEHPDASASDWLIGVDVEIHQGKKKEQVALDEVITAFRENDLRYSRDPAAVGMWLTRHGHPDESITLLTAPAASDPRSFAALVDAYLKAAELVPDSRGSRLDAAAQLVRRPPSGVNAVELEIFRIKVARARGDKVAEEAAWTAAVSAVEALPSKNWGFDLARSAVELKRVDQRLNAMSAALRHRRGALPTYHRAEGIIVALAREDRFKEVLAICRNLALHEPNNPVLQNNLMYLQLLFGELAPAALIPGMEGLWRNNAGKPDFALSLALAQLLNNQTAEAIKILEGIPPNPELPQRAAFLGTAYRLVGRDAEGVALLSSIRWNDRRLLRAEVSRLQDLLAPIDEAIAKEKEERERAERERANREKWQPQPDVKQPEGKQDPR